MSEQKIDGVIDAVRYENGQITWVRAYERRGATFSDVLLLGRAALIDKLANGKFFFTGRRKPGLGGMFTVAEPVRLLNVDGRKIVATGPSATRDDLAGTPVL
jgi:hypothetical protein